MDISCSISVGECVCLIGDSGSGKTTLLLAIKGMLHNSGQGSISSTVSRGIGEWSTPIGLVFQNAESQILCTTVMEEVAFGPENLCVPPDEIGSRVRNALRLVGLDCSENRNVEHFSAGQKQRLAIASVLSMDPVLLLLDEPTSQLDKQGKQALCELLTALKRQGYTILMTEHDPRPFEAIIDQYLLMEKGSLGVATKSMPTAERFSSHTVHSEDVEFANAEVVIDTCGLCLSYPETGVALNQLNLQVLRGERIHLYGRNGAGKSSLLRCLSGLERPDSGSVTIAGFTGPRPELLPGKVGVLFQNPARQLFAENVFDEVAFSLRRMGHSTSETERIVTETLCLCGIDHLADRAPLTLSFGEQHRVALAMVVAPQPTVLLLDEPFAGLDIPQRLELLAILGKMPTRFGTTVLIASHDELPDERWADRMLFLSGGALATITP
jgi:energy-coupling factor transport system ATP-binding protein